VMRRAKQKSMKAVSLFSGCGGLDLGMKQAGFEVVLANDLDRHCGESFKANFPEVPFHLGPVSDLKPKVIRTLSPAAMSGEVALLFGGPPCPPFSKSRFYRKEKPRGINDPVGLETLTGFMDVV